MQNVLANENTQNYIKAKIEKKRSRIDFSLLFMLFHLISKKNEKFQAVKREIIALNRYK